MATFMTLFRKEMRRRQASFGTSYGFNAVIIAAALGSYLLLMWHPTWPPQAVVSLLSWLIIIVPVMALAVSLEVWSYEWEGDHQHLLLSLPLAGRTIMAVKTAAVAFDILTFLLAVKVVLLVLAWIDPQGLPVFQPDGTMAAGGPLSSLLGFTVTMFLVTLAVTLLAQFAWLAGALVSRLHVYAGLAAGFVGAWLMLRAAALSEQLLGWLPHATWWMMGGAIASYTDGEGSTITNLSTEPVQISLGTGPLVAAVAVGGLLYMAAAYLLEGHVEV